MGNPLGLRCALCNLEYMIGALTNLCQCGGPLLVDYDFSSIESSWSKESLRNSPNSMWRYDPVLPVSNSEPVTLGEGFTPLFRLPRLAARLGASDIWLKDESRNPTASFKARGMSAAVTMARKLGATKLAAPSAGNAGGALATYAAAAGLEAHIFMPDDVPEANYLECVAAGAHVTLVPGFITDCARIVAERSAREGWFEVTTLKEPYRIEGKKTMGYEIAEQLDWELPDAILYPCGGGVGLIGISKAFDELATLGWIGRKRPKLIAVQAAGCAPLVRAFESGSNRSAPWPYAFTVASGLRVPKPLGDFLILRAIRESNGTAVATDDEQMLDAGLLLAEEDGVFAAPECGACVAALPQLFASEFLDRRERIVILNTGSGLKYLEAYATRFVRGSSGEADKLGGLITPR
jgi:threonine synthase